MSRPTQRRDGAPENRQSEQHGPAGFPSLLGRLCTYPVRAGVEVVADLGLAATLAAGGAMLRLTAPQAVGARAAAPGKNCCPEPKSARRRGPRPMTVTADDGTQLHAESDGDPHAPVTVVFCHGYALTGESWVFQREALRRTARVVVWDHRGHGRSDRGRNDHATIEQLGSDLFAVVQHVAPRGPVVLVGHSMGAMSILALARQRPELFGARVVGVGLLATAAGPISGTLGLPSYVASMAQRVLPGVLSVLRPKPRLTRWAAQDLGMLLTRRYAFASEVPERLLEFLGTMIQSTPLDTLADFLPRFSTHDGSAALPVLRRVKTLVMVGDHDLLTPVTDSQAIADALPNADFVVAEDAGHAVILERSDLVTTHLQDLLDRVQSEDVA